MISTIAKNVSSLNLVGDDPILSGIIDSDHVRLHHPIIDRNVNEDDWKEFSKIDLNDKVFPYDEQRVTRWIDKAKKDHTDSDLKRSIKSLIRDFSYVWVNSYYQKRSILINESTFTHDILAPILKFIAPSYFKRWTQAQSLSAKDRGVLKYVDIIGNIEVKGHLFENFFVEVSHGPFHPNPDQHIVDDNVKLAKLGKDSFDRNSGTCGDMVLLFHLHAEFIRVYAMDYQFHPVVRKIPLDLIQIPFFSNDPSFKLTNFVKVLFKYRCILEGMWKKYQSINVGNLKRTDVEFSTFNSPKKLK